GLPARRGSNGFRRAQPFSELPAGYRSAASPTEMELGRGSSFRAEPPVSQKRGKVFEHARGRLADRRLGDLPEPLLVLADEQLWAREQHPDLRHQIPDSRLLRGCMPARLPLLEPVYFPA